jgi:hypothetical protein
LINSTEPLRLEARPVCCNSYGRRTSHGHSGFGNLLIRLYKECEADYAHNDEIAGQVLLTTSAIEPMLFNVVSRLLPSDFNTDFVGRSDAA